MGNEKKFLPSSSNVISVNSKPKKIIFETTHSKMDSNTSSILLGFILTMCLISSSTARPSLSDEEKAKLSTEEIEKLRSILEPGGRIRPGMLSNMKYDISDENLNLDESLDIITTHFDLMKHRSLLRPQTRAMKLLRKL